MAEDMSDFRHPDLLRMDRSGLIVVDVQEAFRPVIDQFDAVAAACATLVAGFAIFERPIIVTEQYPKGLGSVVPEISEQLPDDATRVEKTRFSAVGVPEFDEALARGRCQSWVLAGVESHVCVSQTVHDLLARQTSVHLATDAVSSRTPENRTLGIERSIRAGAIPTSVEAALFEMLEVAGTPSFKQISKLVK
jgi:nicotinamidase-related amidase